MTNWILIRRLRGPAFVLLVGVTALLNQWDILSFGRSWPLYLILAGLLSLAERAALSQASLDAFDPVTGQPRAVDPAAYSGMAYSKPGSSIVPATPPDSNAGRP